MYLSCLIEFQSVKSLVQLVVVVFQLLKGALSLGHLRGQEAGELFLQRPAPVLRIIGRPEAFKILRLALARERALNLKQNIFLNVQVSFQVSKIGRSLLLHHSR